MVFLLVDCLMMLMVMTVVMMMVMVAVVLGLGFVVVLSGRHEDGIGARTAVVLINTRHELFQASVPLIALAFLFFYGRRGQPVPRQRHVRVRVAVVHRTADARKETRLVPAKAACMRAGRASTRRRPRQRGSGTGRGRG